MKHQREGVDRQKVAFLMARLFFLIKNSVRPLCITPKFHTPTKNHWAEQVNSVQTKNSPTCLVLWPEEQRKPWRLHRKVKISMFTSTEMRVWVGGMARTQKRSEGPLSIGAHIKTQLLCIEWSGCPLPPNNSVKSSSCTAFAFPILPVQTRGRKRSSRLYPALEQPQYEVIFMWN